MRMSTSTGRSCSSAVKVFCGQIKITADYVERATVFYGRRGTAAAVTASRTQSSDAKSAVNDSSCGKTQSVFEFGKSLT